MSAWDWNASGISPEAIITGSFSSHALPGIPVTASFVLVISSMYFSISLSGSGNSTPSKLYIKDSSNGSCFTSSAGLSVVFSTALGVGDGVLPVELLPLEHPVRSSAKAVT